MSKNVPMEKAMVPPATGEYRKGFGPQGKVPAATGEYRKGFGPVPPATGELRSDWVGPPEEKYAPK